MEFSVAGAITLGVAVGVLLLSPSRCVPESVAPQAATDVKCAEGEEAIQNKTGATCVQKSADKPSITIGRHKFSF
jgi:hypothetical protein